MKRYIALCIAVSIVGCTDKKPAVITPEKEIVSDTVKTVIPENKIEPTLLIIPGESIGLTSLGQSAETLAKLGRADLSDAAMGKAWMSWYSKKADADGFKSELMIKTSYKDSSMNEKVIKEIRINSADFKTRGGNGKDQDLARIKLEFPDLKVVAKYKNTITKAVVQVYDDTNNGIGFEIQQDGKCIAVIVHPKQQSTISEYLVLHDELVRL